jgi:hypothetical protein
MGGLHHQEPYTTKKTNTTKNTNRARRPLSGTTPYYHLGTPGILYYLLPERGATSPIRAGEGRRGGTYWSSWVIGILGHVGYIILDWGALTFDTRFRHQSLMPHFVPRTPRRPTPPRTTTLMRLAATLSATIPYYQSGTPHFILPTTREGSDEPHEGRGGGDLLVIMGSWIYYT